MASIVKIGFVKGLIGVIAGNAVDYAITPIRPFTNPILTIDATALPVHTPVSGSGTATNRAVPPMRLRSRLVRSGLSSS